MPAELPDKLRPDIEAEAVAGQPHERVKNGIELGEDWDEVELELDMLLIELREDWEEVELELDMLLGEDWEDKLELDMELGEDWDEVELDKLLIDDRELKLDILLIDDCELVLDEEELLSWTGSSGS